MRVPSSFRDPSGSVFVRDGVVFRQVNSSYQEQYDHLMGSGLHDALVSSVLLVRHEEIATDPSMGGGIYKILQPGQIPFISYPYEWGFSQLKDAALTTLQVLKKALEFGMTLKDSSAYNIQFLKGQPIFIDLLSFQKYHEGEPWIAYRQFCQHFLAPLALMAYKHVGAGQLSRIHMDGIPLDLASSLLPVRTQLKPSMQIHIHLHSRLQKKFASKRDANIRRQGSFKLRSFLGLIDGLESAVKQLRWRPARTDWIGYYDNDAYAPEALASKIEIVTGFLKEAKPDTVWDFGANTGKFGRLASDMGISTVSFDHDPAVVERSYSTMVSRGETKFLPLLLDLTNPSPGIGWANRERMDLSERGPVDMLFALALVHHLAIANNVPLGMIAEFFGKLCLWAVIEFVPKMDEQVERLLETRDDIFPTYTIGNFETEFGQFFDIRSKQKIIGTERTLYLMRRK